MLWLGLVAVGGAGAWWALSGSARPPTIAIIIGVMGALVLVVFLHLRGSPERAREVDTTLRRLGPAGILAVAWTSVPAIGGTALLIFIDDVSALLEQDPTLGLVGYICVFIVFAGLGLLPTYAQAILGGWVFGLWVGFGAALAGFVGAAVVGYAVGRTTSRDRVERVIADHPRWEAVRKALVGGGRWKTLGIVTLVRVPPNSPFALTNLVLCSTGVKLVPFVIGTAVGMAPRTFLAVWLAAVAREAAADGGIGAAIADKPRWVLIVGVVSFVAVVVVLGQIGTRALDRVTRDPGGGLEEGASEGGEAESGV